METSSRSITDPDKIEPQPYFFIKTIPDKTNFSITIEDSGIGMTKNEPINNLGTTAKSGTRAFMDAMAAGGGISLIGQFGVGFYSAYLAADTVRVVSKNNDDEQYIWVSGPGGSFPVQKGYEMAHSGQTRHQSLLLSQRGSIRISRGAPPPHDLVKKHSEFIGLPIELHAEKSKDKEVTASAEGAEESKDVGEKEGDEPKNEEVNAEKEKEAKKKKTTIVQKDMDMVHGEVKRGTKVNSFLKEDHSEFLEEFRLTDLQKKPSEPFGFPTELLVGKPKEGGGG